jgi:methylenetetrahydrofolate--tRNA-(uracil-5-)-methyltransferase
LLFAGQITGVEWYLGNIATGLLAGINAVQILKGQKPLALPKTTMLGALCYYITHANMKDFQPMKANFGILPPLSSNQRMDKRAHARMLVERADIDLGAFLRENRIA